ncbi:MAG TPA: SDR family oxidoreductase [Acidimicrobiales bacterium]|nr:SDR family oxidoreductase [Acidimicrobiales bacterium]
MTSPRRPVAIITGASRGLGAALARRLAEDGWTLVLDARGDAALRAVGDELAGAGHDVRTAIGDVSDPAHRQALLDLAGGHLDALVNNASLLGPSPQPALADYPAEELRRVYDVNVIAPLALAASALPHLRASKGCVVNITSDAGVEAYEGWGGYGSSKAALEHASRILAAEEEPNGVAVYVVDPGDMRTQMHQEAFPGEDISDRPPPEVSVPGLVTLLRERPPSGRYVAREVTAP